MIQLTFPKHFHYITDKKGIIKIILNGEKEVNCNRYDSTFITSNIQHELINETDEEVHAIIIYGSVDVNRTFSKTGLTVLIGSKEDNFTDK